MNIRSRILVCVVCCGLASVFAADKPVSDDALSDQVRLHLANDAEVGARSIDVVVHDGSVTLKGKVRNEKQKDRAGKIAKKVRGVRQVANDLVVTQE